MRSVKIERSASRTTDLDHVAFLSFAFASNPCRCLLHDRHFPLHTSSHLSSYGRRLAAHRVIGRRYRHETRNARCFQQHTSLTAPRRLGFGLNHVWVGKDSYSYWLIQFSLRTFSISFSLDAPLSNLHLPILLHFRLFFTGIIAAFFSPSSSTRSTSRMLF